MSKPKLIKDVEVLVQMNLGKKESELSLYELSVADITATVWEELHNRNIKINDYNLFWKDQVERRERRVELNSQKDSLFSGHWQLKEIILNAMDQYSNR